LREERRCFGDARRIGGIDRFVESRVRGDRRCGGSGRARREAIENLALRAVIVAEVLDRMLERRLPAGEQYDEEPDPG
jgi:hypothetical protein